MPAQCPDCGCTDIEHDPAQGIDICTGCCTIVSNSGIVNEVQFSENSKGQSSAIGRMVNHDSDPSPIIGSGSGSFNRESRQITLHNALKKIKCLVSHLNLGDNCIQQAHNFYKLCLTNGMTRGRKSAQIIGSCVYIACRVGNISVMLIEISDALEMDVFELGHTFLRVKESLHLNMKTSLVDPVIYIEKLANRLEFDDKEHAVAKTAVILAKIMMQHNIHVGRRPSGVSGAALLIAARFHGFNRTIDDIVPVARVHNTTIRKRLIEFGNTESSEMSIAEYIKQDVTKGKGDDPPSFKAARKREEEQVERFIQQNEGIHETFDEYRKVIEKALIEKRKKNITMASVVASSPGSPSSPRMGNEDHEIVKSITDSTLESIQNCLQLDESGNLITKFNQIDSSLLPSTATLGLTQTIEESMESNPIVPPVAPQSCRLELDGLDDEEIDSYILSESESKLKAQFWMKANKEYLDEMEKKRVQEQLDEEQRIKEGKPPKKERVSKKKNKEAQPARTAGEAMEKFIKEKKLSSRIDYSVLKSLNGESEDVSDAISTTSKVSTTRSSRTNKSSSSSKNKVPIGPLPDHFMSFISKIKKNINKEESKRQAEDDAHFAPLFKKQKLSEENETEAVEKIKEVEEEEAEEDEEEVEPEEEEERDDIFDDIIGGNNEDNYEGNYSSDNENVNYSSD